jgi:hypothetical protein
MVANFCRETCLDIEATRPGFTHELSRNRQERSRIARIYTRISLRRGKEKALRGLSAQIRASSA